MLSFELSAIDIVLAIAIIILLLLHMKRTPAKYVIEPELSRNKRKTLEESRKNIVMPKTSRKEELSYTGSLESSMDCPHHFGYLKTLPLGSSVPQECYNCSRMMQCLFSSE